MTICLKFQQLLRLLKLCCILEFLLNTRQIVELDFVSDLCKMLEAPV